MSDQYLNDIFEQALAAGITMTAIAAEAAMPRATVYRIRDGRSDPRFSTRMKIKNAIENLLMQTARQTPKQE